MKTIRLTEKDLTNIIKRVISEEYGSEKKFRRRYDNLERLINSTIGNPDFDPTNFSDEFDYAQQVIDYVMFDYFVTYDDEIDEDELVYMMKEHFGETLFDVYRSQGSYDDDDE